MKKILFTITILISIFQVSSGQNERPITKGYFLTGGSLSFDIDKTNDYEPVIGNNPEQINTIVTKTLETDLYLGYYIMNHMAIGIKTDILVYSRKHSFNLSTSSSEYKYNDLSFGPFIRYSTNLGLFFEGSGAIGLLKSSNIDDITTWKNYSFSTGVGYSLFVSKTVAIEPEIKYRYLHRPSYEGEEDNEISNKLSFEIGFQIYLNTKKDN